ncbi:hypothetical protein [Anaerotruncus colihominis]|uniref:hypothetical protein n=1 Tax=Anaerotruncus colihominis TaxID=169435 RepID=UPI0018983AB4|nr:hypothetical protein [Anaerotruncus colihominis]
MAGFFGGFGGEIGKIPSRKADKQTEKVGMNGLDTFFCTMRCPGKSRGSAAVGTRRRSLCQKRGTGAKYIKSIVDFDENALFILEKGMGKMR